MKFMLVIYNDSTLLDALPAGEADGMMRDCLAHADELRGDGYLIESQMLQDAQRAKSVRIRNGRLSATDGPFAEVKEYLAGFYLVDCDSMERALEVAAKVPGAEDMGVEVRPVLDNAAMDM
jgi:hypothetical protein